MASLDSFNANEVEPHVGFDPLPAGDYLCVVAKSEKKPTKKQDGFLLELELQVIDGPSKGRILWDRLNMWNPNPKATEIARAQMSALCRAVGVMQPKDSTELHNIPLIVSVKVEKREDNGEYANRVTAYKPRTGARASTAPPPAVVGQVPAGAGVTVNGTGKAPWMA